MVRRVYAVSAEKGGAPFIALGNLHDAVRVVQAMHRGEDACSFGYISELAVFGGFDEVGEVDGDGDGACDLRAD